MTPEHSEFLSMPAGAKLAGVSIQTFWRWALYGVRGGIKVSTWLRGGRRFTSSSAIESFFAKLNAEPSISPTELSNSNASQAAAEATLDAAGI